MRFCLVHQCLALVICESWSNASGSSGGGNNGGAQWRSPPSGVSDNDPQQADYDQGQYQDYQDEQQDVPYYVDNHPEWEDGINYEQNQQYGATQQQGQEYGNYQTTDNNNAPYGDNRWNDSSENLPPRTLARVAREIRDLHKNPPEGVRLVVDGQSGVPSSLGEVVVSVF